MTATIDPRIRERRIAVTRVAGRRRLRLVLVVVAAFLLVGLAYLSVESPLLDVDHVRVDDRRVDDRRVDHVGGGEVVDGERRTTDEEVRAAAGIGRGAPLLRVDTGAAARRIETLPWVADAQVDIALPGTVRIAITERLAAAYVRRGDTAVALLGADGTVIADAPAPVPGLVELRGLAKVPAPGARITPAGAAAVVGQLPEALATRVVAVDIDVDSAAAGSTTLVLAGSGTVRLCASDDIAAKGAAAVAVLDQLGPTPFSYIDVCVPQTPASA